MKAKILSTLNIVTYLSIPADTTEQNNINAEKTFQFRSCVMDDK